MLMEMKDLCKWYDTPGGRFYALNGVDLTVSKGEMISIIGASGSGKSTLLHIMGCLDQASSGVYRLKGHEVTSMAGRELDRLRRDLIGFVFQGFFLMPLSTALENVTLPLQYRGASKEEQRQRGLEALDMVGLRDKADARPSALSGGQQQRVAIARALITDPPLLLADEPTGNLDPKNRDNALSLLRHLWKSGKTVVLITHDPLVAKAAPRSLVMEEGQLKG